MVTGQRVKRMLVVAALLVSPAAAAGNLSFGLSLTGLELTLINQGDSSAYYPAVFRMLADGQWEPLGSPLAATGRPAELPAGARLQLAWPGRPEKLSALQQVQPVLVYFFDQAGVGFGQIAFFRTPPLAKTTLHARYADGALQIDPPDNAPAVRASWVLWPQEDGIAPIRRPVRFEHRPPPARHVDWQRHGGLPYRLHTGAGQPAVLLLHETGQGFALQQVPGGGLQGREQRAAWLDATAKFYAASLIALLIAAGVSGWQFLRWQRQRAKP